MQRHHLHTPIGEESERLLDIEQRGIFYRKMLSYALDVGHQSQHIGRTILQFEDPLALVGATVGIDIYPVEMLLAVGEILLGRGINHLDILNAHTMHILSGDSRQHLVTLQRNNTPKTPCQRCSIHTKTAGQIQQALASDTLCRGTLLTRRLLKGSLRDDTTRRIEAWQLALCTLQVLHLRSHLTGIGELAI